MWQQFIHTWNGAGFFLTTSWVDSDTLTLYTDASGTLGYGGILGHKWFQGRWETHQQLSAPGISIAWQELFALVVACHIWGEEFAQKRIVFYCDNASVVSIVNSKGSRIPRVMDLVRHLTRLTLRHNFYPKQSTLRARGMTRRISSLVSRWTGFSGWLLMPTQPHVLSPQYSWQSECRYPELLKSLRCCFHQKNI